MKRLTIMVIIAAAMSLAMPSSAQGVDTFVTALLEQYPAARLLDIYKSSFQDYMGAEHLVGDIESARGYLDHELATTDASELLPWYYEPCGVQGRYVRVSLKAVYDSLITRDVLLDAFVRSANDPERPTVAQWAQQWHEMIAVIDTMSLGLPHYDEDKRFIEQVLDQGKYAISHSPDYRDAYAPHYRIVGRDIFEAELLPMLCP